MRMLLWLLLIVVFPGTSTAQTLKAYMSLSPVADKVAVSMIKQKYGINILFTHLSYEELETRLKAEAPHFPADVVLGSGFSTVSMAKKNGWSVPYRSPYWEAASPTFVDRDGYWVNPANCSFGIVGNARKLAEKGLAMPTSWKELLQPQWKGEIVAPSPLSSGIGFMQRATWLSLYGDDEGWRYIKALDANIHHYTRGANAPTELVGRGEFLLGLSSDEQIKLRQKEGYPLSWVIPSEGVSFQGTYSMILKTTSNLEAAHKVIDFLGSQEFSRYMGEMGYTTVIPSVNALYGNDRPKYVNVDLQRFIDRKSAHNETWKSLRSGM